jgi:O-antigen/teichoic acid export membrane protein
MPPSGSSDSRASVSRGWLRRVWGWRRDATLRRLYLNTGKLFSGQVLGAIVNLGTIWFATAGLGLMEFGILAAILSFTGVVGNTSKFSTWEAVVKYGADDLARKDTDAFRRLIAFSTLLDFGTAIAALAICAALVWAVLPLIQVPWDYLHFALFLCLGSVFTLSATPVGVLRLFDRFGLLAMVQPVGPLVRLVLCALCYQFGGGIWAFGAAYLASSAIEGAVTVCLGWRELHRHTLQPDGRHFRARHTDGHPGLWKFVLANNGRLSLIVLTRQSDDLIVAAFGGPAAAALWRTAKQAATVLSGPARLFVGSVLPELARQWSAQDYRGFRRLVVRSSTTAAMGAIVVVAAFALVGDSLLEVFFHKDSQDAFVSAFVPSLLLMTSRIATLLTSPFLPAMSAMGRALPNLTLTLLVALVAMPVLVLLTWQFGIVGAGFSRIFSETLTAAVFGWTVLHTIDRRLRRTAAAASTEAAAPAGSDSIDRRP